METGYKKRDLRKRGNRFTPPQVLAMFFFAVIFTGALLLTLPVSTVEKGGMSFVDALFTSTSAVCVTGLVVVDTGTTFTYFGKTIIMILIEFGGLGIMTFASVAYVFLRKRMSVADMLVMKEALNQDSMSYLTKTIANIVKMTLGIEAAGAFLLSFRYIPMYGPAKGAYFSIFHAVSAFCNAGFDINAGHFTSIMEFADDPLVVLTTSALIIIGGTGFAVLHELMTYRRKKNKSLSLQARVVAVITASLLIAGTIGFLLLEMNNPKTLGNPNMSFDTKVLAAFFQSVTTRTAGFNTIDQNGLTMASKLLSIILMFIGASPASTGGGIKTTTFCIMIMACMSIIKGDDGVNFKYRRISTLHAIKAFVIAFIMLILVLASSMLIMMFDSGLAMDAVFFETFSAAATVGLSVGITPTLSAASRIVLIITMFAGRVEPLTLTMALAGTRDKKRAVKNVETRMMIG